jgi:cytochrome b
MSSQVSVISQFHHKGHEEHERIGYLFIFVAFVRLKWE